MTGARRRGARVARTGLLSRAAMVGVPAAAVTFGAWALSGSRRS